MDPFSAGGDAGAIDDTRDRKDLVELKISVTTRAGQHKRYEYLQFLRYFSTIHVASNFDYDGFRQELFKDLQIPVSAPLFPPGDSGIINIDSRRTCIIALTQIQGADFIKLPFTTLNLNVAPEPIPKPPGPEIVPPTPKRRPGKTRDSPAGTSDEDSDSGEPGSEPDSDDDDDGGPRRKKDILKDFVYPWADIPEVTWEDVCRFFSCKTDVATIRIQGINLEIEPYQAFAIYRTLLQPTTRRYSFIVGDDVGLGKTGVALCAAAIFSMIRDNWREVKNTWDNDSLLGSQHLPQFPQDENSVCPTQEGRVQCPCKRDGLAYRLMDCTTDFPTVIMTDPGLIPTWAGEAAKWIDSSSDSPAGDVQVLVAHNSFKGKESFLDADREYRLETIQGVGSSTVARPGEGSRNIVIISRHNVSQFIERFRRGMTLRFQANFVFLDEFHNYSGDKRTLTRPFKALANFGSWTNHPVFAIGLSSDARADIAHWRPLVQYAFDLVKVQPQRDRIPGLRSMEDFDRYEASWKYLVDRLDDIALQGREKVEVERRKNDLFNFLEQFIPAMMISRDRGDLFRGQKILPRRRTEFISCNSRDAVIQDAFGNLISQVKSLINQQYMVDLKNWNENNQMGVKPSKKAVAERQLEFFSDRPGRSLTVSVSEIMLRSSTFPAVARLLQDTNMSRDDTLGKNILPIATRVSGILGPGKINDEKTTGVLDMLETSPWWYYRDLLYEYSPKIQEVERQILKLIDISSKDPDDPSLLNIGPPPPDGTTSRHIVLYSDYPLSAFLTFMLLFNRLNHMNVEFCYVHSGIDMKKRQLYVDYMQQNCTQGDPVKVLISTLNVLGRGVNLSRASTVVITDIPRSSNQRNQAFGRVDRRGQGQTVRCIQLHDQQNLMDEIRRIRNENREEIAIVGHPLADQLYDGDDNAPADEQGAKDEYDAASSVATAIQGIDEGGRMNQSLGIGRILSYETPDARARALQAFPNGMIDRIFTSGEGLLCGIRAVIGSIQSQLPELSKIPDEESLMDAVYAAQKDLPPEEFQVNTFGGDTLLGGLRIWAEENDVGIDFELGYIQRRGTNDGRAFLLPGENLHGIRRTVWVYHIPEGIGHWEILRRVPSQ